MKKNKANPVLIYIGLMYFELKERENESIL